jgi:hypothetical protein
MKQLRCGIAKRWAAIFALLGTVVDSGVATAADPRPTEVDAVVQNLLDFYTNKKMSEEEKKAAYEEIISGRSNYLLAAGVAVKIAKASRAIDLAEIQDVSLFEIERSDKHLGASSTSSASTSAVEKPGLAWLLGLAVETGAITQKEDKSGVTLSTSPYAFVTLGVPDTPEMYDKYDLVRRLGISGTFALDNSGTAENRNFDSSALTEASAKYVLWGDRSPRSPTFRKAWNDRVLPYVERRASTDAKLAEAVVKIAALRTLADKLADSALAAVLPHLRIKNKAPNDLAPLLKVDLQEAIDRTSATFDPATVTDAEQAEILRAAGDVVSARKRLGEEEKILKGLLSDLEQGPEITAAYTFHRKEDDADYSELKVLAEYNAALVTFVGNAAISLNHDRSRVPPTDQPAEGDMTSDKGKKRDVVRAYSVSFSLEKPIPNFLPLRVNDSGTDQIALSLNGKFMRLEDEHDEIGVVQAKAVFPVATGVDLPVSVTYATRSEYVDEDEVRGNFGISVDTDKLWSLAQLVR